MLTHALPAFSCGYPTPRSSPTAPCLAHCSSCPPGTAGQGTWGKRTRMKLLSLESGYCGPLLSRVCLHCPWLQTLFPAFSTRPMGICLPRLSSVLPPSPSRSLSCTSCYSKIEDVGMLFLRTVSFPVSPVSSPGHSQGLVYLQAPSQHSAQHLSVSGPATVVTHRTQRQEFPAWIENSSSCLVPTVCLWATPLRTQAYLPCHPTTASP